MPFRDKRNRLTRRARGIPLIRAGALASSLTFLRRLGAPLDALVERANLRPEELEDPEALVPLVFANRLLDSAARATGIPDLGLVVTRHVDPLTLGTYGRLIGRSQTLGAAIDASIRHKLAWNTGAQVWLTRLGGEIDLHHRFFAARDDSWNQMVAGTLMLHVNLLRRASGNRWRPRHVSLPVAASRGYQEDPMLADARIDFGAPWTTIRFPASLLALPLFHPAAQIPDTVATPPLQAPPRDLVASVRGLVTSLLGKVHPSIALVAEAADMTVRTFQRRLADEGLTYDKIIAEIRLAEASRLLVESDRKIIDIALELGYSDPAHFTRAFRAWTESSPLDFRRAYGGWKPVPVLTPTASALPRVHSI